MRTALNPHRARRAGSRRHAAGSRSPTKFINRASSRTAYLFSRDVQESTATRYRSSASAPRRLFDHDSAAARARRGLREVHWQPWQRPCAERWAPQAVHEWLACPDEIEYLERKHSSPRAGTKSQTEPGCSASRASPTSYLGEGQNHDRAPSFCHRAPRYGLPRCRVGANDSRAGQRRCRRCSFLTSLGYIASISRQR